MIFIYLYKMLYRYGIYGTGKLVAFPPGIKFIVSTLFLKARINLQFG
jgi:hypothetical protein